MFKDIFNMLDQTKKKLFIFGGLLFFGWYASRSWSSMQDYNMWMSRLELYEFKTHFEKSSKSAKLFVNVYRAPSYMKCLNYSYIFLLGTCFN